MRRTRGCGLTAVLLLVSGGFPLGCGGPENTPEANKSATDQQVLVDVGELYRVYTISQKKPPTKLADLTSGEQVGPLGAQAIRNGDVIVRFGAALPDTAEDPGQSNSEEILAWQKETPEAGGMVLLLNRTVKSMTADEFKAASKAGTTDSSADTKKKK